jgi:hypothetical protein
MSHTVKVEDLADYVAQNREEWQRFATASTVDNLLKVLEFNSGGFYRVVLNHSRVIYIGCVPETAVREYNAA